MFEAEICTWVCVNEAGKEGWIGRCEGVGRWSPPNSVWEKRKRRVEIVYTCYGSGKEGRERREEVVFGCCGMSNDR